MQVLVQGSGQNQVLPKAFIASGVVPVVGVTDCRHMRRVAWQIMGTNSAGAYATGSGGITGTWKVRASNSLSHASDVSQGGLYDDGLWTDVTGQCDSVLAGTVTAGSIGAFTGNGATQMVVMKECYYRYVEIEFTPTGGQGAAQNVRAFFVGKAT